jgi:RNase adaptor protein for sRNA GlmZ degradation
MKETMIDLKLIDTKPKKGDEALTYNGVTTQYALIDFWRWNSSNILSNATRGRLAEFIVSTSIEISPERVREEWDAFDLVSREGIKIEVKSAAYIQSWQQKTLSVISFRIKPARYWDKETNTFQGEPERHADVYVFCHLKHKDKNTIDPLKMEQWNFYIVPTYRLNERSQNSINLNSLKQLTDPVMYGDLKDEITKAYKEHQNYMHKPTSSSF